VPRSDDIATAEAFRRLFDNPMLARQWGEAGRQRVCERYRLEQTIEAYWNLYRRQERPVLR
jgi:glycosyltransferase involved in cell wall biosynthesis